MLASLYNLVELMYLQYKINAKQQQKINKHQYSVHQNHCLNIQRDAVNHKICATFLWTITLRFLTNFYSSCTNGNRNEYSTVYLLSVLNQLITVSHHMT